MSCEVCTGTLVSRGRLARREESLHRRVCGALYVLLPNGVPNRRPFRPIDRRWAAASEHGSETEHALTYEGTLCGLARDAVETWRHLWRPGTNRVCPACRELAAEHMRRVPQRPPGP